MAEGPVADLIAERQTVPLFHSFNLLVVEHPQTFTLPVNDASDMRVNEYSKTPLAIVTARTAVHGAQLG